MMEFMDIGQAAEFLKVKPSTLYAWVYQRRIPFRKHGRRVVFEREELGRWSESQSVQPVGVAPWSAPAPVVKEPQLFENQTHRERR